MRYIPFLLLAISLFCLASCENNSSIDIPSADSVTLSRSIASINSPSRKIIRNSDIRCRVKYVYAATAQLEDLVRSLDGQVAESRIQNEIGRTQTLHYRPDSQKIVREYMGTAHLALRVPVMFHDSLMKAIPALADFIDSRSLKQTDATYAYLSNAMQNERAGVAPPVISDTNHIDLKPNPKPTKIVTGKEEEVMNRRLENLQLLDDVNYATVNVELYQPTMADVQIIADPDYIAATPFGTRISVALADGWGWVKPIIVFAVMLWPLWLIVLAGVFMYRWFKQRRSMVQV